jgi:hypothetical protein
MPKFAAGASCCEHLLSSNGPTAIIHMKIDDLPSAFLLTEKQVQQLKLLPQQIVEHHVQVLNHEGRFYHLYPELVFDMNEIVHVLYVQKIK